ncbi:MAG TPA: caa(3)-type oxidase subunit IV [Planctomycetaceae bacterium]|nr:caa(3)-type oxidase subunit IV [Planctomycetaceae bacterium]
MNDHPASSTPSNPPEPAPAHVVSVRVLVTVFVALMGLTALTLLAAQVDLGQANLLAALGIATVKAALVALYFMHLRYDHPFYALVFVTALLFVALFLSLTLLDTIQYQPDMLPGG